MQDQISNVVAEVFIIEDQGIRITLRDKNKRSLGSFFKTKQDGNETVAYKQFLDMEIKSGSVIDIGFKEVPYKDGVIKNIISFREASGKPIEVVRAKTFKENEPARGINTSMLNQKTEATYEQPKGQDAFGRRLAIHGMTNSLLASGMKPNEITTAIIDEILTLEDRINHSLELDSLAKQTPKST